MDFKTLNAEVAPLLRAFTKPPGRASITPAHGKKTYRGKEQCWVGYHWSRPGSHFMTGTVYDAPLAYGDTYEDALERLRAKADVGQAVR